MEEPVFNLSEDASLNLSMTDLAVCTMKKRKTIMLLNFEQKDRRKSKLDKV